MPPATTTTVQFALHSHVTNAHSRVTLLTTKCRLPRNFATFSQSPLNCRWGCRCSKLLALHCIAFRRIICIFYCCSCSYCCCLRFICATPLLSYLGFRHAMDDLCLPLLLLNRPPPLCPVRTSIRSHICCCNDEINALTSLSVCPFKRICTHLTATLVTFGRVWLLHLVVGRRYAN